MTSAATATRRSQILEAAAELFSESGSAGTSIAAVAARVGISDAGVLYHFPTKEQLLLGVLGRYARGVEEDIEATGVRGIELLRLVREWGAGMEDTPEVSALLIKLGAEHLSADGSAARQVLQEAYHRVLDRYISAFATAASRGDLRADLDPVHEASALVAHLDGIRLQWFMSGRTISMADSVRRYVDATLERLAP